MAGQTEEKLLPAASKNWADKSVELYSILEDHVKSQKNRE
jgi:hypothetical protein